MVHWCHGRIRYSSRPRPARSGGYAGAQLLGCQRVAAPRVAFQVQTHPRQPSQSAPEPWRVQGGYAGAQLLGGQRVAAPVAFQVQTHPRPPFQSAPQLWRVQGPPSQSAPEQWRVQGAAMGGWRGNADGAQSEAPPHRLLLPFSFGNWSTSEALLVQLMAPLPFAESFVPPFEASPPESPTRQRSRTPLRSPQPLVIQPSSQPSQLSSNPLSSRPLSSQEEFEDQVREVQEAPGQLTRVWVTWHSLLGLWGSPMW